jgi:hypothetical protein
MKRGVPQFSILWPVYIYIYIYIYIYKNDLSLNTQGANLVLFADNTNLLITEEDETALTHKIKNVEAD